MLIITFLLSVIIIFIILWVYMLTKVIYKVKGNEKLREDI
jgi:hypothetical protein